MTVGAPTSSVSEAQLVVVKSWEEENKFGRAAIVGNVHDKVLVQTVDGRTLSK